MDPRISLTYSQTRFHRDVKVCGRVVSDSTTSFMVDDGMNDANAGVSNITICSSLSLPSSCLLMDPFAPHFYFYAALLVFKYCCYLNTESVTSAFLIIQRGLTNLNIGESFAVDFNENVNHMYRFSMDIIGEDLTCALHDVDAGDALLDARSPNADRCMFRNRSAGISVIQRRARHAARC